MLTLSTGANAGLMSSAQFNKLDGIQSGATSNATNAQLRDRSTHTGTQTLATISNAGTAAAQDVGTAVGNVVQLYNVGGNPGLPAVDGSQLTNLPGGEAVSVDLSWDPSDPYGGQYSRCRCCPYTSDCG